MSENGLKGRQLKKQKTVMQQAEQVKYKSCDKDALVATKHISTSMKLVTIVAKRC